MPASDRLRYASSVEDAAENADALLILTDWKEFAHLDLFALKTALRYPIVIDGRNLYDPNRMQECGFTYVSMGRPTTSPVRQQASPAREHTLPVRKHAAPAIDNVLLVREPVSPAAQHAFAGAL